MIHSSVKWCGFISVATHSICGLTKDHKGSHVMFGLESKDGVYITQQIKLEKFLQ